MNRKIPFHELAGLLAANCNITPDEAEDFIKSFFELIAQSLTAGETVKIKSIGTFIPTGDVDNPIEFTPDAQIADTINAPFALFEPEVLSDTLSDSELSEISAPGEVATEVATDENSTETAPTPIVEEEVVNKEETVNPVEEEVSAIDADETPAPAVSGENTTEIIVEEPETEHKIETEIATVTIPDTVTETEQQSQPESEKETEATSEAAPASEPETSSPTLSVIVPDEEPVKEFVIRTKIEPKNKPVVAPTPAASVTTSTNKPKAVITSDPVVKSPAPAPLSDEEESEEYVQEKKSGSGFGMGFLIGTIVGLALGACAVYFAIDYIFPTSTGIFGDNTEIEEIDPITDILPPEPIDTATTSSVSPSDTIAETPAKIADENQVEEPKLEQPAAAPAQPKATKVKDTIQRGYVLTDMAKKHYGNKCFWVYIYEENKSKISNPNRVSPGLELVIPDAAKYGIDASSQSSVKAANAMAGKILSKYPR